VAWNSTPAVSMNQLAEATLVAPIATHTCPALLLNVPPAGAWNFSAAVLSVSAEGTGETSVDHPIVGDGVPPLPCAGVAKESYCAKYARSGGFAVTNFAFTVTIGFENAMLPAAYTVGEQNAM